MLQHIRQSFAAKLNIYILSCLIILFLLAFGVFYHYVSRKIETQTYEKIFRQANDINQHVSHLMRTIEKIPNNLSCLIPTCVTIPDSIFTITRQVVENNEEIFGCAIAFEPYYFPSKGPHFAPYSYMKGDSVITTQISSDYDYYQKNWYKLSKELNSARWSRPYHELSSQEIITSTYSVPLRNSNGKIIGIFSVDLSLNWLTEIIDSIKPYPDCYIIIINQDGRYMFHNQNSAEELEGNIFEKASTMPDTNVINIARRMSNGETGKATIFDHNDKSYIFYSPITGTQWYMATICPYKHIYEKLNHFNLIVVFTFILFLIFVCLFITITIRKFTLPLKKFAFSATAISEGNFNTSLPIIHSKDEMRELYDAFKEMQIKLSNYIHNLEKTTAAKEKIESELRIAHDIQMSMLPKDFPSFPGKNEIDLYAELHPARQVGGDLYDFFIRDNSLCFAIGDVSGKGIPASLLMASTISLLRSFSATNSSPAQIVRFLNNSIAERNETDMFVTFFIGILDLQTGQMKYCNAGHTLPVITYPDQSVAFFNIKPDLPLGIMQDHPYQENTYQFNKGSGILLYTDGVTDAENAKQVFYGKERLLQTIRKNQKLHPRYFIEAILKDIQQHIQTHPLSDDLSMLTFIYGKEWNIKNS